MHFNVRVYGLLVENGQVLLSEEFIREKWITKFPGGGLEQGEGTRSCLEREFMEEFKLQIRCGEHFYTTDFYIRSVFDESQVISIYYFIDREFTNLPLLVLDSDRQRIRWVPLDLLSEDQLDMVGDRKVARLLQDWKSR